jgi:hypothetical protein
LALFLFRHLAELAAKSGMQRRRIGGKHPFPRGGKRNQDLAAIRSGAQSCDHALPFEPVDNPSYRRGADECLSGERSNRRFTKSGNDLKHGQLRTCQAVIAQERPRIDFGRARNASDRGERGRFDVDRWTAVHFKRPRKIDEPAKGVASGSKPAKI